MILSVQTLFTNIIDYAGIFPPAKLGLQVAMQNYQQYRSGSNRWMLGSFVLPASRLNEFKSWLPTLSASDTTEQWPLSVIIADETKHDLSQLERQIHADSASTQDATIIALEFSSRSEDQIEQILPSLPSGMETFFEIPLDRDPAPTLNLLKGSGVGAKVRTGGITETAFPDPARLGQFILACAKAQVPFKATAGLHHLLPGRYPMTYEPNSSTVTMMGFLPVAIAATLAYCQQSTLEQVVEVLQTSNLDAFHFTLEGVIWNDRRFSLAELTKTRQRAFRSFGSCSFQEPVADVNRLQG
jgi:hypothetical protein